MLRKNITQLLGLILLFASTAYANAETAAVTILNIGDEPEGITYNSVSNDYTIVYESLDINGIPILFKTKFIPPTKISPKAFTKIFDKKEFVKYKFIFSSSHDSNDENSFQQNIINAELKLADSQILADRIKSPDGWFGMYDNKITNSVGWFLKSKDLSKSIRPGKSLSGFEITSRTLPGVVAVKFRGKAPTLALSGEGPRGELGNQLNSILKKDFVSVFTSGPVIDNPVPFNSVAILESMKLHIEKLTKLNYISESLYIRVYQTIDAAINAVNLLDEDTAEDFIDELSKLIGFDKGDRKHHKGHKTHKDHKDHKDHKYDDDNDYRSSDISIEIRDAFTRSSQFNLDYIKHRL